MILRKAVVMFAASAALVCLAMVTLTVLRHAEGHHALAGVKLSISCVSVSPGAEIPFAVTLHAESTTGYPYTISSIRFVIDMDDFIAGVRPEHNLFVEVPAHDGVDFEVPVEPGSVFEDDDIVEAMSDADLDRWTVYGSAVIQPPRGRASPEFDFRVTGGG